MTTSIVSNNAPVVHSNHIEASWDQAMTGTLPESPWRQAFRDALSAVAEKARAALPQTNRKN